jgi:sugar phosphate isomerase/epimerase
MTRRLFSTLPLAAAAAAPNTKMLIQLDCGSIGVKATQPEALDYAIKFGFDAVTPDAGWLAAQSEGDRQKFLEKMKSAGVRWGAAGLPVEFRRTDEDFRKSMQDLPGRCRTWKEAGVTRVSTWLNPTSDSLTYLENFRIHVARLREIGKVLNDAGIRLGLEFVGPKTSWASRRFPFVHTMKEMRELIAEVGLPNLGLLMDSWHWFNSGETAADIARLANKDVVSVDLNDAPAGIPLDQQKDGSRELPCATGVIPTADFLKALQSIGCDAPARCEPFNAPLRAMPPEQALAATAAAMKKAFSLIA